MCGNARANFLVTCCTLYTYVPIHKKVTILNDSSVRSDLIYMEMECRKLKLMQCQRNNYDRDR